MYRSQVLICGGTGCTSSQSMKIIEAMEKEIKAAGLENEVNVVKTGCFGLCALGPIMIVYPEGVFYSRVTADDIPEIVEEHILKGRIVKRLLYQDTASHDTIQSIHSSLQFRQFHGSAVSKADVQTCSLQQTVGGFQQCLQFIGQQ